MRLWKRAAVGVAALAVVALAPEAAMAAPELSGSFNPSEQPGRIAAGPDGNVWFTLTGAMGKEFAKIEPDGTITEYDTPTDGRALVDVTSGPNGHVWFSYNGGVLEVNPANGNATEHPVAQIVTAAGITTGADGNLWVVDAADLVKVGPNGAFIQEFLAAGTSGRDITLGSDGRVWWVDFGAPAIRATNTAGVTDTYPTGGGPQEIAAGPAGQLAYGNSNKNPQEIARIGVDGAIAPTEDPLHDPFGVAYGTDGAYWFAEFGTNTLGRLSTDSSSFTHPIEFPANTGPRHIAAGAGNTLWVSAETSNKIWRIVGVVAPPPDTGNTGDPGPTGNTGDPGTTGGTGGDGQTTTPPPDTVAPVLTAAKVDSRGRTLALTLDEPAALRLQIAQRVRNKRTGRRGFKNVRTRTAQGVPGPNKVSLGRKLKKGTYRVIITATDGTGNARKRTVNFTVKK